MTGSLCLKVACCLVSQDRVFEPFSSLLRVEQATNAVSIGTQIVLAFVRVLKNHLHLSSGEASEKITYGETQQIGRWS